MADLTLIRFLKSDRGPQGNYNPGDLAGFDPAVAKKLVAQGFAELADVGKGAGKVDPQAIAHLREGWEDETDPAWQARAKSVEAAKASQAERGAARRA